jgi:hypothetical protein
MILPKISLPIAILSVLFLFSCSGRKKETDFGVGKHRPNSLIRNQLLFSSFDQEFSFPIWFDDSIVAAKKIEQIIRNIYPESSELKPQDSVRVVPAESFHYYFKKNGQIEKVIHKTYFDYKLIGQSTYRYSWINIENGFSKTKKETEYSFDGTSKKPSKSNVDQYVLTQVLDENSDSYLKFEKFSTNENLFILPNKKRWGSFRLHKQLKPTSKDILLVGSAYKPLEKYKLKNTIHKFDVQEFIYEKDLIRRIIEENKPFLKTRDFQYDRRGYVISYIDSLFSDKEFLSRTVSKFTNNMLFCPQNIEHRKENLLNEVVFKFYETFEYEYRK